MRFFEDLARGAATLSVALLAACGSTSVVEGGNSTGGAGVGGSAGAGDATGAGGTSASGGSSTAGGSAGASGSAGSSGSGGALAGGSGGQTGGTGGASGGSGGAPGGGGAPAGGEAGGGATPSCLQGSLVDRVTGSTVGATDDFTTSCGSAGAGDLAFEFVAPATDYYVFDTAGSDFDTTLALFAETCAGPELACNDNFGSLPSSRLVARLEAGQRVIVAVDGNLGERGDVVLAVSRVTCPNADLGSQLGPRSLTTIGGSNQHTGSCGGEGFVEKAFRWTAPNAALYQFSVRSSEFSPALYVEQGPICGGTLLQCNDNVVGGYPAQVTRRLEAGEAVTLIVDSSDDSGAFELEIAELSEECPSLPELTGSVSATLLNGSTGATVLSPSCGWAGNMFGGEHSYPEHSYLLRRAPTAASLCTYTIASTGTFAVSLLRGSTCAGEEVECHVSYGGDEVSLSFSPSEEEDFVLMIDNQDPFGMDIEYTIEDHCP